MLLGGDMGEEESIVCDRDMIRESKVVIVVRSTMIVWYSGLVRVLCVYDMMGCVNPDKGNKRVWSRIPDPRRKNTQ